MLNKFINCVVLNRKRNREARQKEGEQTEVREQNKRIKTAPLKEIESPKKESVKCGPDEIIRNSEDLVLERFETSWYKNSCQTQISTVKKEEPKEEKTFRSCCKVTLEQCLRGRSITEMVGVSQEIFDAFLLFLSDYTPKKYDRAVLLLLFFHKLKHGTSFKVLTHVFGLRSETSVAYNFYAILDILFQKTQHGIRWFRKEVIEEVMPDCFRQSYKDCTVIIDCSEVFVERVANIDNRNRMYSRYKSHHTAKFLLGKFCFVILFCYFVLLFSVLLFSVYFISLTDIFF